MTSAFVVAVVYKVKLNRCYYKRLGGRPEVGNTKMLNDGLSPCRNRRRLRQVINIMQLCI